MGLFSSKTTITVGTSVSRVMKDALIPNAVNTGITKAHFMGGQLVENILEELVASVGVRASKMHAYGKNGYIYGLPSSTLLTSTNGATEVLTQLRAIYGAGLKSVYHRFGPLNNLHFGWKTLCDSYGYDSATNQLDYFSAEKKTPVYLKDMVVVVSDATLEELANGSLDQWGSAPNAGYTPTRPIVVKDQKIATPFMVDAGSGTDRIEVTYVWQVEETVVVDGIKHLRKVDKEGTFSFNVSGYDVLADYFQVKYTVSDRDGYWIYKMGAGTYPSIDNAFATKQSSVGSFFPFGYFRFNKTSMAGDTSSEAFKSSKKLMRFLGMNFEKVTESINENPGIADVEQAMLMMVVPANTKNHLEQQYLFDFFDRLYNTVGSNDMSSDIHNTAVAASLGTYDAAKFSLVIEDARFKTAVSCSSVTKITQSGVIGIIGSHASGYNKTPQVEFGTRYTTGAKFEWATDTTYHYYQRQITDTLYEEVRVANLAMTYYIFGSYTAVGHETEDILLIPLDYAITNKYSITEREKLYSRSLHYVFNSKIDTVTEWYMQSWFQVVLVIAAIAISLYDGGYTLESVLTAIATASATEIVKYVAMRIVYYYLNLLIFKAFVKVIGPEAAMFLAAIALAAGIKMNMGTPTATEALWADRLLLVSSGMVQGANLTIADSMEGLQKEYTEFSKFVKTQTELLEEAENALLKNTASFSPDFVIGQTPEQFYALTIHSGNIGTRCFDMVSSYVDTALTLPTISQTI